MKIFVTIPSMEYGCSPLAENQPAVSRQKNQWSSGHTTHVGAARVFPRPRRESRRLSFFGGGVARLWDKRSFVRNGDEAKFFGVSTYSVCPKKVVCPAVYVRRYISILLIIIMNRMHKVMLTYTIGQTAKRAKRRSYTARFHRPK